MCINIIKAIANLCYNYLTFNNDLDKNYKETCLLHWSRIFICKGIHNIANDVR